MIFDDFGHRFWSVIWLIFSKFHVFSAPIFASILGSIFDRFWSPFWTPLAAIWRQLGAKCAQNPPSGAKRAQKSISRCHFLGILEPTCFEDLPQALPGTIFDEFGADVGTIFVILATVFDLTLQKLKIF